MSDLVKLQLETLCVFDPEGRILSTREPAATAGPLFLLIRGTSGCAWAARADVSKEIAGKLDQLAREEPPLASVQDAPLHADEYLALLGGHPHSGPAFTFPETLPQPQDVVLVEDEALLNHHFRGWMPGEIQAGRGPVLAVIENGFPVSICFCSRRTSAAAEAGLETAQGYRGQGFGARVTAAWAWVVRATGRIPLYSTDWSNAASLAVARKLGLEIYAVDWSISDTDLPL